MIEVQYHKSTVLILTDDEFARAVSRGKAKRRREAFERCMARIQQERDAPKPAEPADAPHDADRVV